VGVNKYVNTASGGGNVESVEVRMIDNGPIITSQLARLTLLRSQRDEGAVKKALQALTLSAGLTVSTSDGDHPSNLLALAVMAIRARATVGEVSSALEAVWGRYVASPQSVRGVYAGAMKQGASKDVYNGTLELVRAFSEREGRQPRILIAKMGQDGHDRGAKVIASSLSDLGFDVELGPLFSTPAETARLAIDADAHVVGVSSQAAGHRTLVPLLRDELSRQGGGHIKIVVGGVIPPQDFDVLKSQGVVGVFGPGTKIAEAARDIL
jgi:methylmalonyl-CoA mutase